MGEGQLLGKPFFFSISQFEQGVGGFPSRCERVGPAWGSAVRARSCQLPASSHCPGSSMLQPRGPAGSTPGTSRGWQSRNPAPRPRQLLGRLQHHQSPKALKAASKFGLSRNHRARTWPHAWAVQSRGHLSALSSPLSKCGVFFLP